MASESEALETTVATVARQPEELYEMDARAIAVAVVVRGQPTYPTSERGTPTLQGRVRNYLTYFRPDLREFFAHKPSHEGENPELSEILARDFFHVADVEFTPMPHVAPPYTTKFLIIATVVGTRWDNGGNDRVCPGPREVLRRAPGPRNRHAASARRKQRGRRTAERHDQTRLLRGQEDALRAFLKARPTPHRLSNECDFFVVIKIS
ncbi:MAG: hypothetical protein ACTSX8_02785 [Alphaproteobacteria bacterium]